MSSCVWCNGVDMSHLFYCEGCVQNPPRSRPAPPPPPTLSAPSSHFMLAAVDGLCSDKSKILRKYMAFMHPFSAVATRLQPGAEGGGGGNTQALARLPENARVDKVKATMENGVLTVTVPKQEVKKPKVKAIKITG
ncbi:hypothetical protein EJ110_NYTH59265 [Nymphaea thermarum]|nr:hypothetical protein EJ110_NYTH59265 [Nymphaea thermarum]